MTDLPPDILLVDDDPDDVELALHSLRVHRITNPVLVTTDGAEALDFLFRTGVFAGRAAGRPKLVLLDLKMPRIDGLEVLRRIRGDAELRTLPVVMLTSSREERDVVESYDLGVNSYITKPVDFEQFSEAMRLVLTYWIGLNQAPLRSRAS